MRKNRRFLWLIFVFLSAVFLFFDYHASKYDFELTGLLSHSLSFKLNVQWYEAHYQLIEEDTQKAIMVADHYFPFGDDEKGVYIEKILKYCNEADFLAVYVKTTNKIKVIVIKNYETKFSRPEFEYLDPQNFSKKYGQLGGCVNLMSIPLFIGLWPILGSILLVLLALLLFMIIKKQSNLA